MEAEMLLEAANMRRAFGGLMAVRDVSFVVRSGEILGMVGANGSGKTTCLNLLTRLLPASGGTMRFDGVDYGRLPAHRLIKLGIARTFQNLRLFKDITVRENVALGVESRHRRAERATPRRVDDLLEFGKVRNYQHVLPASLPYGTQRVVEILRALASGPRLLFLDEPFAGMSSEEAREICTLLLTVRQESDMAVVIVDHNVEVLTGIAERLVALAEGQLVAEGDAHAVLNDPGVVRSYVGADV
jgi:branched-chain amino acid transport system ATP-binding protein